MTPPRLEPVNAPREYREMRGFLRNLGLALLEGAESPDPRVVNLALMVAGTQGQLIAELLDIDSRHREAA